VGDWFAVTRVIKRAIKRWSTRRRSRDGPLRFRLRHNRISSVRSGPFRVINVENLLPLATDRVISDTAPG